MILFSWSDEELKIRRTAFNVFADPFFKLMIQFEEFSKPAIERFGELTVDEFTFRNREPDPLMMDGKRSIMDAVVLVNGTILIDIEMQVYKKNHDSERFSHYSDLLNVLRTKRGDHYRAKESKVLLLSKYRMRKDRKESKEPIMKCFEDGAPYDCKDVIVPVELVYLKRLWKKPVEELSAKERLMLWMEYSNKEEYASKMNEIYKIDKELVKLETRVRSICMSDALYFQLKDEADEYFNQLEKETNEAYREKYFMAEKEAEKEKQKRIKEAEKRKEKEKKLKEEAKKRKEEAKKREEKEQKLKEEEQKRKARDRNLMNGINQLLHKGFQETEICNMFDISIEEFRKLLAKKHNKKV